MKINKNLEAIIITLLYLTCLYFWTLPIQKSPMPYGEVDAASHYAVGEYTYYSDKSITVLPYYIDQRYGKDNQFKPHYLWYPPPFHTTFAISSVFGGDANFSIYLANAILCSLIILSVYFIVRRFFGFEAALISGFLLIFSMRDIMVYLWGQWPERAGFAYLPLIIYCFYKYCVSYLKKEERPIYIIIMSILLAVNLFIHPMDFFHSVAALIVISVFFLIKEKRLFFNIKYVLAAIILFLLVISIFPYQSMNVIMRLQSGKGDPAAQGDISRLFHWFEPQLDNEGVPQSYFYYKDMIAPRWTIPLIFLGILFLLLRRNKKDLVMLGWLVALYIMIHLDFIGKGRVHRSLSETAHIFYPLIVLGLIYLVSLVPKIKQYKVIIKYGLLITLVIIISMSIGTTAKKSLEGAYSGILRVNPHQYELTNWLREGNVQEDADMYHMGAISLAKTRWLWMVGHRHMYSSAYAPIEQYNITHVIMDYSDFALAGHQAGLNQLQAWEQQNLVNNTLIYNKNYIRVYEFES
ncbi:MAG: DUF6541 family protein [Nanoarchaeota archaeon]|nr:DUF6541 family protein [Nanoarchaeota archaeon]